MATSPDRASHFPAIEKRYGKPMSYWFTQMKKVKGEKYADQMAFLQEKHGFSRAHANALVLYLKGSTSSRRYDTFDDYLATLDEPKAKTIRAIFATLTAKFKKAEIVIAWNQPMLKHGDHYVFGLSASKNHLLINPHSKQVLEKLAPRLKSLEVSKHTVRIPLDWKVNASLLQAMVRERISEI